jgi:hypothetical protein
MRERESNLQSNVIFNNSSLFQAHRPNSSGLFLLSGEKGEDIEWWEQDKGEDNDGYLKMMMKELEESNWFKKVEERKTQGLVSAGREGMIFGDGDETYRCPSGCNSHDLPYVSTWFVELVH